MKFLSCIKCNLDVCLDCENNFEKHKGEEFYESEPDVFRGQLAVNKEQYYKMENPDDYSKKKFVALEIKANPKGFINGGTLKEYVKGWTNHDFVDMRFYSTKKCLTEKTKYSGHFKDNFKKVDGAFCAGISKFESNMTKIDV